MYHIYDSRGSSTVECQITTSNGIVSSIAPGGASTGKKEVASFPNGGVDSSLSIFNSKIKKEMLQWEFGKQKEFDKFLHELDGTENLSNIGGAMTTVLSLSYAKASAIEESVPLYEYIRRLTGTKLSIPYVLGNVMNGGRHAVGGPDIQEYLSLAMGKSARESVEANYMVHKVIMEKLKEKGMKAIGKGDEGGWVTSLGNIQALEVLSESCNYVREQGFEVYPALDLAASQFYNNGLYRYREQTVDGDGQVSYMVDLADKYNIKLIEDPFDEDDFDHFAQLTEKIGNKTVIVGDDLYTTSTERLKKGIGKGSTNAVLVKVNQIGTLSDTIEFIKLATMHKYKNIVSHRSGESCDNAIAHLAVGCGAYAIKTGVMGGERVAKLNELIKIDENRSM
jgi:enolase